MPVLREVRISVYNKLISSWMEHTRMFIYSAVACQTVSQVNSGSVRGPVCYKLFELFGRQSANWV